MLADMRPIMHHVRYFVIIWRVQQVFKVQGLLLFAGGRQLDYAPTALEVLPAINAVVKGRVPILMVRTPTHVLVPVCAMSRVEMESLQPLEPGRTLVLVPVLYLL